MSIDQDHERDALRESIYLLESQMEIEQEFIKYENRKPAKILITSKIPEKDEFTVEFLPF